MRNVLVEGLGLGFNPKKVARLIQDAFGQGLTDALRMTRTVNLWSYRESARANYTANGDVVQGWIWYAELDDTVCPACAAQHGSIHPLDEELDGHYNCRCAPIPYIEGISEPVASGQSWFEGLSSDKQRDLLGPGKYDAWKEGKFEFSQLSHRVSDDTYGHMTVEQTLQGLLEGMNE